MTFSDTRRDVSGTHFVKTSQWQGGEIEGLKYQSLIDP